MSEINIALGDGTLAQTRDPFFIIGSGRCGTTLMRRLIIEQTGAVIPPENYILKFSSRIMGWAGNDWERFCGLALIGMKTHSRPWAHFRIDASMAHRLLANMPAPFQSIANFWHGFYAIYANQMNKPSGSTWGDKTPTNFDALAEIIDIFPQARFVFMVRDVFDMASSYASMSAVNRWGSYLEGAERWVASNTIIQAFVERFGSQCLIVRYEDLVRFPDSEMSLVLAHLRLPRSAQQVLNDFEISAIKATPGFENVLNNVTCDFIGKGRAMLPPDVKETIAEIAFLLQLGFNYEPSGTICRDFTAPVSQIQRNLLARSSANKEALALTA